MKNKFSILFLSLLLILFNACTSLQVDRSLVQKRIDSLLVSDFFRTSQAAVSVFNLTENKPVYNLNEEKLFRPASNQKILTTAAALLFLGSNHKFTTSVYYSGEIKDSILDGNIYIVGGFDPEFSSRDLDSLTREIRRFGIKEIKGNLLGDVSAMDSLYWGSGWMWDDDPNQYAPYLTPLTINKNTITIYYQPGEIGNTVKVKLPFGYDFIPIENKTCTVASGKSTLNITRDWLNKNNTIIVTGVLPINSKPDSVKINLVNPHISFLQLTKNYLNKNKIVFAGRADTSRVNSSAKRIFSYERNILPIINNANKNSDNLNAEMLLRELAHSKLANHSSAKNGKIFIDSLITLTGNNSRQFRIVDGSGLSFYNLVNSHLIINVLKFIYNNNELKNNFIHSLPIAGVDGTLANRFINLSCKGHVFAKTGGLSGVSNLSGYIETTKKNNIAFSILVQNFVGNATQARLFQEKICQILFEEL